MLYHIFLCNRLGRISWACNFWSSKEAKLKPSFGSDPLTQPCRECQKVSFKGYFSSSFTRVDAWTCCPLSWCNVKNEKTRGAECYGLVVQGYNCMLLRLSKNIHSVQIILLIEVIHISLINSRASYIFTGISWCLSWLKPRHPGQIFGWYFSRLPQYQWVIWSGS